MIDPMLLAHQEWLGYLQPAGLVVSPPALVKAQAIVATQVIAQQQALTALVEPFGDKEIASLPDFGAFTRDVLGWDAQDLVTPPESLEVPLPAYQDVLRPSFAVPDPENQGQWLILVQVLSTGIAFDKVNEKGEGWAANPQERFERLLREVGIATGLLFNGTHLRLVYAPKGETSGHLTFPIEAMTEVAGRPILGGLLCLLDFQRVFDPDKKRRLSAILEESRKYQSTVSNALAGQVLEALHELLRGVQAADEASERRLLTTVVPEHYDHLYGGLVSVLMRLVFLLYAEDRELMPRDAVYERHYSVGGLYERLRADAGQYPDTMDQRFGAWAHLLALFRLVHDGGHHAGLRLPARNGALFNPDSFPFLEGRPFAVGRVLGAIFEAPRIADGVIYRVLQNLLTLRMKGSDATERLSYRTLDVEQIGSVYEAIMGFGVERAIGPSIGVKPKHIVVDLAEVLKKSGAERSKFFAEEAECKLTPAVASAVAAAKTAEEIVVALGSRVVSPYTPALLPKWSLYLQPGDERRRSGSHYTPRELTSPIVATTLRPVLEALGERPTPEQILDLKVCDPAMGSGAFLVEACRQLGEKLVEAWAMHGRLPTIPADEEPLLHARRLVAQRCLYGVDKNPMAVGLAKFSLWLVTLARDHAFTFLDHALKHGDSLVGFSRQQIAAFRWDVSGNVLETPLFAELAKNVGKARDARQKLQCLGEDHEGEVREAFNVSEAALVDARLKGNLLVAAFFAGSKPKEREDRRRDFSDLWEEYRAGRVNRKGVETVVAGVLGGARPVPAFHWEVEFPEVFDRENGGFDAFVGNPPFLGGKNISGAFGQEYLSWQLTFTEGAAGQVDLVAYFFRNAFKLLRESGSLGLLTTNTIAQGDTRLASLSWIVVNGGGTIFNATRRMVWPGIAAVVVSIIHIFRGSWKGGGILDRQPVGRITPYLFSVGPDANPCRLAESQNIGFAGPTIDGAGFIFDDTDPEANSIATLQMLIADPLNKNRIFPLIGGEEFLNSPTLSHRRWIIDFGEMSLEEAKKWPDLLSIVNEKVKPKRLSGALRDYPWWRFKRPGTALRVATSELSKFMMQPFTTGHLAIGFISGKTIVATPHIVFAKDSFSSFCTLQTRSHEVWVRFFASSFKDDLRYTPSDCLETFPFPPNWQSDPLLETAGQTYYDYRAALMIQNNEGLTKTYNRFHDPEEHDPGILRLRELHANMDRAVLHAYGWDDVPTNCEFLLDYEEPEEDEDEGKRKKKKPWRYRWPDDVRDDVLARLLELNRVRAEEEALAKATGNTPVKVKAPKAPKAPKTIEV